MRTPATQRPPRGLPQRRGQRSAPAAVDAHSSRRTPRTCRGARLPAHRFVEPSAPRQLKASKRRLVRHKTSAYHPNRPNSFVPSPIGTCTRLSKVTRDGPPRSRHAVMLGTGSVPTRRRDQLGPRSASRPRRRRAANEGAPNARAAPSVTSPPPAMHRSPSVEHCVECEVLEFTVVWPRAGRGLTGPRGRRPIPAVAMLREGDARPCHVAGSRPLTCAGTSSL